MSDLFLIIEKLIQNKVSICLQARGKNNLYNLAVVTPKGKSEYFHSTKLDDIELKLKVMWGHLLKPVSKMPLPPPR